MKTKITNLNIAGLDIPLNSVESFEDSRVGEYDSETREINILSRCFGNPTVFMPILVHEMAHCALDLSGANYEMSDKTEEQVVTAIETLLVPAVKRLDNTLSL